MSAALPKNTIERFARIIALCVGALDLVSGIGLTVAPEYTLPLMLIPVPGTEALAFVRFVGAFVLATGASYLFGASGDQKRLRALFALLFFPRFSVGLFTGVCVFSAGWPPAWLVVSAVDLGLAAAQICFLRLTRDSDR